MNRSVRLKAILAVSFIFTGCDGDLDLYRCSPEAAAACPAHSRCRVQNGEAVCICDDGYVLADDECIPDPCEGVSCSGHGNCVIEGDEPECECETGYVAQGLDCVSSCSEDSDCDDGNECTDDICTSIGCAHLDNTNPCDDDNVCSVDDVCLSGECISFDWPACDDGNHCTTDSCDPVIGCVFELGCQGTGGQCREDFICDPEGSGGNCDIPGAPINEGLPCDDGNACTRDDACSLGECTGVLIDGDGDGVPPESCGGTDCDDGDPLITGAQEVFVWSDVCTNGLDDDCDGKSDSDEFECGIARDVCDEEGWCLDSPFAVGHIKAVWGSGANDIWAVGGATFHYDGQVWESRFSPANVPYWDVTVWGSSPTNVWVFGQFACYVMCIAWEILHWNGSNWTRLDPGLFPQQPNAGFRVGGVWGFSRNDAWIVGDVGAGDEMYNYIFHWDGITPSISYQVDQCQIEQEDCAWFIQFSDIAGSGPDDIWVVGACGQIIHWDGQNWTPTDSGTEEYLSSVWVYDANQAWAVGTNGAILHWNGSEWLDESFGTQNYEKIWGLSPNEMWLIGDSSELHWNGSEWQEMAIGFSDIWGTSADDLWVAGGNLSHWDGQSWTNIYHDVTKEDLNDVFAVDNSNIWAIGDNLVLYRDGIRWIDVTGNLPMQKSNAIWAADPNDAWIVGDGGQIAHFDGSTWTSADTGTDSDLYSIWGSHADSIWAVGCEGTILHWNGTTWMPMESGTSETLLEVHGSSDSNVWAVGENSTVLRWDGLYWQEVEFTIDPGDHDLDGAAFAIRNVLVFSPDDVWLVSDSEGVYYLSRWDGSQWSDTDFSSSSNGIICPSRIRGSTPDNVWVYELRSFTGSGEPWSVFHYWNGQEWSEQYPLGRLGTTIPFNDLAVTEQGSLVFVGPGGVILRYWGCRTDADCIDAGICVVDRVCSDGLCTGGNPVPEGSPCDDNVFCNGEDTCDANGNCIVHTGDPCGDGFCDEDEDECR